MRKGNYKGIFQQKYISVLKSVLLGEKIGRTLLIISILLILTILAVPNLIVTPYPAEDQISLRFIKAPYDFSYEDKTITEINKKEAVAKVKPVYDLDLKIISTTIDKVKELFEKIKKIQEDKTPDLEKMTSKFREKFPKINISDENLKHILNYPKLDEIEEDMIGLLKTWLSYGTTDVAEDRLLNETKMGIRVKVSSTDGVSEKLVETTENIFLLNKLPLKSPLYPKAVSSSIVQEGTYELAKNYLLPNLRFNQKETEKMAKEALKKVEPVMIKISKGEKIIGEGEKVDRTAAMKLAELERHHSVVVTTRTFGFILLIYVLMILSFIYLYKYQSNLLIRNKNLVLTGLIIITAVLLTRIISFANLPLYIIPMGAFAILLAVLLNEGIAIFISIIISMLIGILVGEKIEFAVLFASGSLAGIYTTAQARVRGDLIRAGIAVGVAQGIIIIGYSLFRQDSFFQLQQNLLWGSLTNGVITTIVAMGGILYLERLFNITTDFTLFELADMNSPILKNLLLKAPGTYHHSLLVGNIAETAAAEVGANPLLIRVASYYHDIGKMIRPEYFIENQTESERNRHESLRSTLSVSILRSHIKDGVEIAKRNRLPLAVIEIIEQHHGASLISYFYHQAKEKEANENVDIKESDFSYIGPKPQSKEAAIVMLADSIEAASRSLIKPTAPRIEQLVKKIIDNKFISGELDECDLTLKDLTKIAYVFTKILITLFHARIDYPEGKEQEKQVSLLPTLEDFTLHQKGTMDAEDSNYQK